MKKIVLILLVIITTGCTNSNNVVMQEKEKKEYLKIKNNLDNQKEYTAYEDLPCNITFSVDRMNEEEISYRVIIDNPKNNMYNVKTLVIHNYFTEDIFPSLGIFEPGQDLIVNDDRVKGISLVGYIDTVKEIKDLNLDIKVWIEYLNENKEMKTIYYDSTEY